MALGGRDGEASCLIGVELACDLLCGHVNQVGHGVVRFLGGDLLGVVGGEGCKVCAPLALACLVHVSLGCGIIDGDVATSAFCG